MKKSSVPKFLKPVFKLPILKSLNGHGAEVRGVHRLDGELVTPQQILQEAGL